MNVHYHRKYVIYVFGLCNHIFLHHERRNYINVLDNAGPYSNHYDDYDVNFMPYDLDSLKNNIKLDDGFNIFHHNSRSLLTEDRLVNYGVLLETINNPIHIIVFTETWLKSDNVDSVEIEGYE